MRSSFSTILLFYHLLSIWNFLILTCTIYILAPLLDYLIQYVSSNHNEIEYLQLIVGSVWKNAISLYKKLGFKIIKVEAHLPRTYYLITMVLNINGKYGYINGIKLFIRSYFIFKLFYKKDSSPSVIGKILKKCN